MSSFSLLKKFTQYPMDLPDPVSGFPNGEYNKEKRKRLFSSERHKTEQRRGPDRRAGLAYDPKSWALESGHKKSASVRSEKGVLPLLQTTKLPAELQHLFAHAFSKRIQNKNSPSGVLYHYTSLNSLMGMVESGEIWMSKADFLNDSSEMIYFSEILKKFVSNIVAGDSTDEWRKYIRKFVDCMNVFLSEIAEDGLEVYVFSLSHNQDSLGLWYNYAQGDGYNIGFNTADLFGENDEVLKAINGIHGYVLYQEEEQEAFLKEVLEKAYEVYSNQEMKENEAAVTEFFHVLLTACATFFKNPAFKSEEEYRLAAIILKDHQANIQFRARHGIIIPFIAVDLGEILPICHVTIGPKNNIDVAKKGMDYYLKSKGYRLEEVKVSKSIAALRY